jgi:hypothetical protein
LQIVGRLLNLNGIKFYSTKEIKDEFGDAPALRWTIGQGQALPGLEEGMMGMRKGSLRKIIVPPAMGYAAGPNLLPQPSAAGRPSLDSVLKVKSDTRQHCPPSNTNLHRKILLFSNILSSLFAAPVSDPSFPQPHCVGHAAFLPLMAMAWPMLRYLAHAEIISPSFFCRTPAGTLQSPLRF